MQIYLYIFFIYLQFSYNVVRSRSTHHNNKNVIRSSDNLQTDLNELYGNRVSHNIPEMRYNPQNIKEEQNYMYNDNVLGIVIDPLSRKVIGILENSLDINKNEPNKKKYLTDEIETDVLSYDHQFNNPNSVIHHRKYTHEDSKNKNADKLSIDSVPHNDYRADVKKRDNAEQKYKKDNLIFHPRQNDVSDYENGDIVNRNRLQKRHTSKNTGYKYDKISSKINNNRNENTKVKLNNIVEEKTRGVNLQTPENKGMEINNDDDNRAIVAIKSTKLEKSKRELKDYENIHRNRVVGNDAHLKHNNYKNDHVTKSEKLYNDKDIDDSSDSKEFKSSENNDGDVSSIFEDDNKGKNENKQIKTQQTIGKIDKYHDTDRRDRRIITLTEEENSDINPDFAIDSDNLQTHVRRRRNFPNFVRHRRSNALLPYQQSAFLQYHGASDDIEDNDGDEFDDDGLDDRTTNLVQKREADKTNDASDYYNNQNIGHKKNADYFFQFNADHDQQEQDDYNQFIDYPTPEQYPRQKRDGFNRYTNNQANNFRSLSYESLQPIKYS